MMIKGYFRIFMKSFCTAMVHSCCFFTYVSGIECGIPKFMKILYFMVFIKKKKDMEYATRGTHAVKQRGGES